MTMQFWIDVAVAALLVLTVGYSVVLNRRLGALRGAQDDMRKLLGEFTEAARKAETGLAELRSAGEQIGRDLGGQVEAARELYDELRIITTSGNELADRIERGLFGQRDETSAGPAPARPAGERRSESERELQELMRRSR